MHSFACCTVVELTWDQRPLCSLPLTRTPPADLKPHQGTMPGKQPRAGEAPLSRQQSVLAAEILRREFDPAVNTQMDANTKNRLLEEINAAFAAHGFSTFYSLRKMEDWRANCVYRWKCRQQKKKPDCWGTDGRKRCRKNRKNRESAAPTTDSTQRQDANMHAAGSTQGHPTSGTMNLMHVTIPHSGAPTGNRSRPPIVSVAEGLPAYAATRRPLENVTNQQIWMNNDQMRPGALLSGRQNTVATETVCQPQSWVSQAVGVPLDVQSGSSAVSSTPAQGGPCNKMAQPPPSLASVLASAGVDPIAMTSTIPLSPLAVSPPSSLGDSSMDSSSFDEMGWGKMCLPAAEPTPSQPRPSMSGIGDIVCSPFGGRISSMWKDGDLSFGPGCSPWVPPSTFKRRRVDTGGKATPATTGRSAGGADANDIRRCSASVFAALPRLSL
jgi:hypothetical protein